jgi:uncharacterized DUF497 family protein
LSFERVKDFDFSTAMLWIDARHDYGEVRQVALGYLENRMHVLCFTETSKGIRVISFRRANARGGMQEPKPLVDEDGGVRELLIEDIRGFRPIAEVASSELAAKLGVRAEQAASATDEVRFLARRQGEARKIAAEYYPFRCCVICGLQLAASLTVAHLDHKPGNNDPDNLAYLCGTHHWMYDAGLYCIEAIKLLRAHWQKTGGKPNHKSRMKDAGVKAALSRKRSAAARKAWQTRRRSIG